MSVAGAASRRRLLGVAADDEGPSNVAAALPSNCERKSATSSLWRDNADDDGNETNAGSQTDRPLRTTLDAHKKCRYFSA